MTNQLDKYLKIKKELSENRQRLGVIGLLTEAEVTTEVRAEQLTLRQRQPVAEGELQVAYDEQRAAQEQGVTLDTADTELRALTKKANVGDVLSSVMERRVTTGATAELQQHFGIGSHQVPLEMLRIDRGVEERAAATVPGSIGDASQAEVISPVFASGDGAFLGIERPTVAVGDSSFPLLSTRPTVAGPFSDSSDAAQTDATFVANSLSPERLQASYSYRRSDAARFRGARFFATPGAQFWAHRKARPAGDQRQQRVVERYEPEQQHRLGVDIVAAIFRSHALRSRRWQICKIARRRSHSLRHGCLLPFEQPLPSERNRRNRIRETGRKVGRVDGLAARSGARVEAAETC